MARPPLPDARSPRQGWRRRRRAPQRHRQRQHQGERPGPVGEQIRHGQPAARALLRRVVSPEVTIAPSFRLECAARTSFAAQGSLSPPGHYAAALSTPRHFVAWRRDDQDALRRRPTGKPPPAGALPGPSANCDIAGLATVARMARPHASGRINMSAKAEAERDPSSWQNELYDLLRRHRVTQFAYVPDAGHRVLIDPSLADPEARSVALPTEEQGGALPPGAHPAAGRAALLMQSS